MSAMTQDQIPFPKAENDEEAKKLLEDVEKTAELISQSCHSTLAKMHAVGSFLISKKQDVGSSNWKLFLENTFPDYDPAYIARMMKLSKAVTEDELAVLSSSDVTKGMQRVLGLGGSDKESLPRIPSPPSISRVVDGLSKFTSSIQKRYGGFNGLPDSQRKQYAVAMRPMIASLLTMYTDEELEDLHQTQP